MCKCHDFSLCQTTFTSNNARYYVVDVDINPSVEDIQIYRSATWRKTVLRYCTWVQKSRWYEEGAVSCIVCRHDIHIHSRGEDGLRWMHLMAYGLTSSPLLRFIDFVFCGKWNDMSINSRCVNVIFIDFCCQERPYHSDSTASRLLSEVKHCRARLVLRWGTTLESLVLFFCSFLLSCQPLLAFYALPFYFARAAFIPSFARIDWWPATSTYACMHAILLL